MQVPPAFDMLAQAVRGSKMVKGPVVRKARMFAALLCAVVAGSTNADPTNAEAEDRGGWSLALAGGVMTDNDWQYAVLPWQAELLDSFLAGASVGYEWSLPDDRWTLGFELQVMGHFGRQDHAEANLPVILRFHPDRPLLRNLESVAFGIGLSHATDIPQVEIDRHGASRRNLIYWTAETEFGTQRAGTTWLLRLHHRSDAFGLLEPTAGSNALMFGIRKSF